MEFKHLHSRMRFRLVLPPHDSGDRPQLLTRRALARTFICFFAVGAAHPLVLGIAARSDQPLGLPGYLQVCSGSFSLGRF